MFYTSLQNKKCTWKSESSKKTIQKTRGNNKDLNQTDTEPG